MKHSNTHHLMRRYQRSMRSGRRSMRRCQLLCGVFGDCGVGVTPQMCNRVTNHGDMGTFSRSALLHVCGVIPIPISLQVCRSGKNTHIAMILVTLSGRIGKVVASHAAVARSIPLRCTDLYYARGPQGVLPMRGGGATSQLDLPSLTPLSVAGCG